MFNQLRIESADFLDNYEDAKGEARKQYRLDRDSTMTLVTKCDTARRCAAVRCWRELEEVSGEEISLAPFYLASVRPLGPYR